MDKQRPDLQQPDEEPEDIAVPAEDAEEVKGGLRLTPVKGESSDDRHKDWIDVL